VSPGHIPVIHSAVALVDDDGKLAGTFSSSDLRGLFMESWSSFDEPVGEWLKKNHPASLYALSMSATHIMRLY